MTDQPKPPGPSGTPPDLSGLPPDVAARVLRAHAKVEEAAADARMAVDDGDVVAAVDAIKRGAAAMDDVVRVQLEDLADMMAGAADVDRPVPHNVLDAVAMRAERRLAAEPASPDASMPVVINSRADVWEPPKTEHPAPWRWVLSTFDEGIFSGVESANGETVFGAVDSSGIAADDPRVRELLRLAPNLERLRDIEWSGPEVGMDATNTCPACSARWTESGTHRPGCWLADTLDRIDKAGR